MLASFPGFCRTYRQMVTSILSEGEYEGRFGRVLWGRLPLPPILLNRTFIKVLRPPGNWNHFIGALDVRALVSIR